jgi:hypothetical protein
MATTLANEVKNLGATTLNYAASQQICGKNGIIFFETAIYCRLSNMPVTCFGKKASQKSCCAFD